VCSSDLMDNIAQEVEVKLEFKLTYAVAKNVRKLEGIEKELDGGVKKLKGYQEYEEKRAKIAEKHASKDKNGNPIRRSRVVDNKRQDFYELPNDPDKLADYEADLRQLDVDYDEHIKAREKQVESYEEELDQLSEFTPHLVALENIPEQGIGTAAMKGLIYMIDDTSEVKEKTPKTKGK
jgi:hypothetical protein